MLRRRRDEDAPTTQCGGVSGLMVTDGAGDGPEVAIPDANNCLRVGGCHRGHTQPEVGDRGVDRIRTDRLIHLIAHAFPVPDAQFTVVRVSQRLLMPTLALFLWLATTNLGCG